MTFENSWWILVIALGVWCVIAYMVRMALKATALDDEFIGPAIVASVGSFLFCGPFCFLVWYILLLQAIHLSHKVR